MGLRRIPQGPTTRPGKTVRWPYVSISFALLKEKCQKTLICFPFTCLEKSLRCRISFEPGRCALACSFGFLGLFWPVPFRCGSQDSAGSSSTLGAALLLISTSSLRLFVREWKFFQAKEALPGCEHVRLGDSPGWFFEAHPVGRRVLHTQLHRAAVCKQ